MDIQLQKRAKAPSNASTPEQTVFLKKHPFAVQQPVVSPNKQEPQALSIQTQLERASRFGHHFGRAKVNASTSPVIQPKLTVGQPGDKYEQEADRVANQVMTMPASIRQQQIQRQTTEEEEQVQTKLTSTPSVQLQTATEEEKLIQTKPSLQQAAIDNSASSLESLVARKGGGQPLPDEVRSFMEPRIGANFSQVRVHTDSEAVQMNQELNAQAFTQGHDIYFGQGKYNPNANDGKRLLAHELTHVIQQTGGVQHQPASLSVQSTNEQRLFTKSLLVAERASDLIQCGFFQDPKGWAKDKGKQAVNWAKEQAKQLVGKVKREAEGFIQGIKRQATNLIEQAKGGARQLVENAKRQAMRLIEKAKQQVTKLIEKAKSQAAKLVQKAQQQVNKLAQKAMSQAKKLMQQAVRLANKIAQPIIRQAQKLVAGGKVKKAQKLIDNLNQKSEQIIENAKRKALAVAQVATRQATQIIDGATRGAEGVIKGATRGAELLFTGAIKTTEGVIQGAQRGLDGIIRGARSIAQVAERGRNKVRNILKPVEGVAGWLVDRVIGVANEIVQFAMRGVEAVGGFVKKLVEPLAQAIRRAAVQIKSLIQRKIQPFMQNVRSGVQKVAQKAREISQGVIQNVVAKGVNAIGTAVRQVFKKAIDLIDAIILKPLAALMEFAELLLKLMSSAGGVLDQILEDPFSFIKNLFAGLKQGFLNFVGNIGLHLRGGLQNFLLGALGSTGIKLPQEFNLEGILSVATQLVGLSYEQIRERGVKKLGEGNVVLLEQGVQAVKTGKETEFVSNQVQGNPQIAQAASLFQAFKQGAKGIIKFFSNINFSDLLSMVVEGVQGYLIDKVVMIAIPRIVAYFTPGAGWVLAAVDAFRMVYSLFIENAQKLAALVEGFSQSIVGAANRAVAKSAKSLESGLSQTFPVLIQVLADWLGVGDIGKTIQQFLNKGVNWVNQTVSPVIDTAIDTVASLFSGMSIGGKPEAKTESTGEASNKADNHAVADSAVTSTLGGLMPGAKGEQGNSVGIYGMVGNLLATKTQQPFENIDELQLLISNVFATLQPIGLKSLNIEESAQEELEINQEGEAYSTYHIMATASPKTLAGKAKAKDKKRSYVYYSGGQSGILKVRKEGILLPGSDAVSGMLDPQGVPYGENVEDQGPIPSGKWILHPGVTNQPVLKLQSGVGGASPIASGYQIITSDEKRPCKTPDAHYCTVPCNHGQKCWTPTSVWGGQRIRIEGSKSGRVGFYIHGGDHNVNVTSGCIKVKNDSVFSSIQQLKGEVPLYVGKSKQKQ